MKNITAILKNKIPLAARGKQAFVLKLKKKAKVLDVGCGNNSPWVIKHWRPDIYYIGIDVGDYNNTKDSLEYADEYICSDAERFAQSIYDIKGKMDAVISSHNIEHCNHPVETLNAMCRKLKNGGMLFLSFPSEKSTGFPKGRSGTLNFYDDPTHVWMPEYKNILKILRKNRMDIVFSRSQYRPPYYFAWGGVLEPVSRIKRKVMRGTWAFWGFEAVIWARKRGDK